jgi:hypothetical protein
MILVEKTSDCGVIVSTIMVVKDIESFLYYQLTVQMFYCNIPRIPRYVN